MKMNNSKIDIYSLKLIIAKNLFLCSRILKKTISYVASIVEQRRALLLYDKRAGVKVASKNLDMQI